MEELVVPIILFLAACGVLAKIQYRYQPWERTLIWLSLWAHLAAVFALIGITKYYYGYGDLIAYHRIGGYISVHLSSNFMATAPQLLKLLWQVGGEELVPYGAGSSTGTMHAAAAILHYCLGGTLAGTSAFIAILAFFSKLSIYHVLRSNLEVRFWKVVLFATMLMPSVVFWSSGLMKESIVIIFLGIMITSAYRLQFQRGRLLAICCLAVGVVGCGLFKGYLLVPFAIATGSYIYVEQAQKRRFKQSSLPRLVALSIAVLALLIAIGSIFPRYDFRTMAEQLNTEHQATKDIEGGSSFDAVTMDQQSTLSTIVSIPFAVVTALLRPAIFEAHNVLAAINALETLALTIMLLQLLVRRGIRKSISAIRHSSLLTFCAVFTLTLAVGVGLSTSNMGTLSRYRMPLIPFFVVVLSVLSVRNKTSTKRDSPSVTGKIG